VKILRFVLIGTAAAIFVMGISKMIGKAGDGNTPKDEPKAVLRDERSSAAATPVMTLFPKGMLPIHAACRSGNAATVIFIIEHGADIHAKTQDGWKPIHFAAASGSLPVVRLLVDRGADPNDLTNDGISVLTIAASTGNAALVEFITQRGADVNH
jgi:uncharacterized protein